jgi:DNA polymerase-3 subunit epsilon
MRILLTDVETSGLVYDDGARVIEVAAALYDTKYASVIESFSALIKHHENGAEHVNGIPVGLLQEQGASPFEVWDRFLAVFVEAECVVAHRAEFDQNLVTKSIEGMEGDLCERYDSWDPGKPWVCTKSDIEWPNKLRGDSLVQLALGLGLGVASAHRAMADVDTMARCLTRAQEVMTVEWAKNPCGPPSDWLEPLFRRAMRPKVRVVAMVSFEQKQLAKDAGFFWDDKRREWYRNMPREDVAALGFRAVERS